jgi:RsiW-degrading membrane proteinase PrsW (M82 family)
MTTTFNSILYALTGGILPALIWLEFWLQEDRKNPEPKGLILKTFFGGMCAVILVIPLQRLVDNFFPGMNGIEFTLWAVLEEGFKFGIAYWVAIKCQYDDEPIDPMIYMITAALGFVALENTLFIINPLIQKDILGAVTTGSLRFVGASLLHVAASSTIGIAFALSFYKSKLQRIWNVALAFVLAVAIHTSFNLFIVNKDQLGTFQVFGMVWAGIAIVLLFFEKVKKIRAVQKISTVAASPEDSL